MIPGTQTKGSAQVQEADNQDAKFTHQRQIADASRDERQAAGHVQKIDGQIMAAIEKMQEYGTVEELAEKLKEARKALAMATANNKAINDLKDERSKAAYRLREAKHELSQLLIRFIAHYQQRSVQVDYVSTEILVKAELGKALEEQQVLPL